MDRRNSSVCFPEFKHTLLYLPEDSNFTFLSLSFLPYKVMTSNHQKKVVRRLNDVAQLKCLDNVCCFAIETDMLNAPSEATWENRSQEASL